jgi:hypothetical protein
MVPVPSLPSVRLGSWAVALLASAVFAGCNKEAPAAAAEPQAPNPSKQTVAAVSPAAAAAPPAPDEPNPTARAGEEKSASPAAATAAGEGFEVKIAPKGGYETGKSGEAEIVLVAKDPFHVNEKYPYKFKLKETPGLKYVSLVVGKDQVKLEAKRASLVVPFTPEKAGKHTVAGLFQFSVCTDDKCLIERRDLSLDIEAK